MRSTFLEAAQKVNAKRKAEIRKEISEYQKGIDDLIAKERREPTAGKAHTFRAATYSRYTNEIKRLKNELEGL